MVERASLPEMAHDPTMNLSNCPRGCARATRAVPDVRPSAAQNCGRSAIKGSGLHPVQGARQGGVLFSLPRRLLSRLRSSPRDRYFWSWLDVSNCGHKDSMHVDVSFSRTLIQPVD